MTIQLTGSTNTGVDATANGDLWITRIDELVTNQGIAFDFGTFTDGYYAVEGSVYAVNQIDDPFENGDAVSTLGKGNGIYVRATGTLWGERFGIFAGDLATNTTVVNEGSIIGGDFGGIYSTAFGLSVENLGTIEGGDGMRGGTNMRVTNSGTILGRLDAGIDLIQDGSVIINTGLIHGENDGLFFNLSLGESALVRNSGTISTGGADPSFDLSIQGSVGNETIINTGLLLGGVSLDGGADLYRGIGGLVSGTVDGGAGNDTLIGGNDTEVFLGGDGEDQISGRGGNDEIDGGANNDTLRGGAGNDDVSGGSGEDQMFGGEGADTLSGGANNDVIRGGDGNDQITGGNGADRLIGGAGADTFIYTSAAQSPFGGNIDIIRDFTSGEDQIDLSDIVGPDLTFIGTGSFSGTQGEVRYVANAKGNASVFADTDGDGVADLRIFLVNVQSLDQGDFLL